MSYRIKSLTACALLLPMLTACDPSSNSVTLAKVPADIRLCFDQLVPKPTQAQLLRTKGVAKLIAELRESEERLSRCGKRLLGWYDTQASVFGAGR